MNTNGETIYLCATNQRGMANAEMYTFLEQNIVTFFRDVTVSKH